MTTGGYVTGEGAPPEHLIESSLEGRRERRSRHLAGRGALVTGAMIVGAWVVIAIFAGEIANHNPRLPVGPPLAHPGSQFFFGTDTLGFDVFSRVMYAPRVDLYLAVGGTLIAVMVGMVLGVAIGMASGLLADGPMRVFDALQAFPLLILALALVAALGQSSISIIAAIAFINVPIFVRIVRSQVLSLRERRFVEAAVAEGNPRWRILTRHIMPNVTSPVLAQATNSVAFAIVVIAALSFLSIGLKPPTPEWGQMIQGGTQGIQSGQWWMSIFPGSALATLVLGFILLGEGLQNLLKVERST
jgi:peptide/nickel transport system permease protein